MTSVYDSLLNIHTMYIAVLLKLKLHFRDKVELPFHTLQIVDIRETSLCSAFSDEKTINSIEMYLFI